MKWLALAVSGALVAACGSDNGNELAALPAGDMLVLTATNQLISYDKTQPGVIRTSATISGLMMGDSIIGIDIRPRNGQLYAITRAAMGVGRLYTINTRTGAATFVATLAPAATPTMNGPYVALDTTATTFAVDFNPAADALRVISDTGQNLRIFVADATGRTAGETFLDGNVSDTTADISGAAYTNSFDGTTETRLLNIDTFGNNLTFQNPPNNGTQVIAAPLGVDPSGPVAFDIDARNNRGFAIMTVGGVTGLYTIAIPDSTATLPAAAAASLVGALNIPNPVVGMVLIQPAAPQAIALDGNTAGSQRLLKFGIRNPNAATATAITGLPAGERLLSIDFRPSNSTVYGLSSAGKIFTINSDTGAATLAVTLNVASNIVNGIADGKRYQVDFNPQADALRIVSSVGSGTQGENYRVGGANLVAGSTNAGVVATTPPDLPLTAGFSVVNIAYTNSFANPLPATTRLFDIDGANNRLALQSPPNNGALTAIGTNFSQAFVSYGGFDISGGDNGMRLLAARTAAPGVFSLFNIDLTAGTAAAATVASGTNEIGSGATASVDLQDLTVKF